MEHRRAFLAQCLGLMVPPLVLEGCRRSTPAPDEKPTRPTEETVSVGSPLPQREPVMRVLIERIRFRGGDLRSSPLTFGIEGQQLLVTHLAYGGAGLTLAAPLTVRSGPRGWEFHEADGRITEGEGTGELRVTEPEGRSILLMPQDRRYPGSFRLTWRSDQQPGAFDLINDVALESYLPGVLASELFGHWEREAFMAQAIAARSFASSEHSYFMNRRHYDVTDTVASQVYAGEIDLQRAADAARQTRGVVLAYENRLVPGYYSSCCGGLAARARDVIGSNPINSITPLDGRSEPDVCTDAPVYEWSLERRADRLARRIAEYGRDRGDEALGSLEGIDAIEILETNAHGRPVSYRIVRSAPGGDPLEVGAETLMRAMNFTGGDLESPEKSLRSSFIEVEAQDGSFLIKGRGFGHGAGLCQYGAQALAKGGRSHESILKWYYPGIELLQSYR